MGVFREQMRDARRTLHEDMSSPAMYFMEDEPDAAIQITVRPHEKWMALGDLKGTNFNYAEMESITPRVIFLLSEVNPARNAVISLEPGVAYRVDTPLEPDDITVTATVSRLRPEETAGFPLPEGA
ncbi:hypothetical protein [Ochrobactrum sp. BTU2]|jgi:hypothetical protein|uniref:hypothetical protein n=1 Tax=Ochrobactrum sp. BTU2 TaxID=2856166 RepID=UPI002119F101|nr:hypothetical protein [Ochrobactrum sp. BTU2]MCQ9146046.1 hypothetical protein [Ochrobactrum sp. BTU2]